MENPKPVIFGGVFVLCLGASVLSGMTIADEFLWAFMLYGVGVGMIIGLKTDIRNYFGAVMLGSFASLIVTMTLFWRDHVAWFVAMLFIVLTIGATVWARIFMTSFLDSLAAHRHLALAQKVKNPNPR